MRAQALSLLGSGDSMLLRITPNPEADQAGKTVVHNPCLSGGTLEIFLEPVLPLPLVAVLGDSPIARAMTAVAERSATRSTTFDDADLGGDRRGRRRDARQARGEVALRTPCSRGVPYVGLVASPKRGAGGRRARSTLADEQRARIHYPAGLDIGARTPAEIALSILAQMVAERPRVPRTAHAGPTRR